MIRKPDATPPIEQLAPTRVRGPNCDRIDSESLRCLLLARIGGQPSDSQRRFVSLFADRVLRLFELELEVAELTTPALSNDTIDEPVMAG